MAKKNSVYWQKIFEQLEINEEIITNEFISKMIHEFDISQNKIEKEILVWHQRIARNNNVSIQEAKKMLNNRELEEFKWTVEEYITKGQENAVNQKWIKHLENASARVHIDRLTAQKTILQAEVEKLYNSYDQKVKLFLNDRYIEKFNRTAYEVQKGLEIGFNINGLNTNQVANKILKPWAIDGKNFSTRIWEDKNKLVEYLNANLTQNLILNEDSSKLINKMSKELNVKKNVVSRLIETENSAIASQSRKESFERMSVEQYIIISTLDSKTSQICQDMDLKVFPMDMYEVGVTAPPFHPSCRTTTAPHFDDNIGSRIARGVDGKTYKIPSTMNYKEWKDKYLKKP